MYCEWPRYLGGIGPVMQIQAQQIALYRYAKWGVSLICVQIGILTDLPVYVQLVFVQTCIACIAMWAMWTHRDKPWPVGSSNHHKVNLNGEKGHTYKLTAVGLITQLS